MDEPIHSDAEWAEEIPQMLESLRRNRFYGSLELKYSAGEIVLLRKMETRVPKRFRREGRGG